MNSEPLTKSDLKDAIGELKDFIRDRELKNIRWFIAVQITYFSITLASVWFMVSQLNGQLLARINELMAHLPK